MQTQAESNFTKCFSKRGGTHSSLRLFPSRSWQLQLCTAMHLTQRAAMMMMIGQW